MHKLLLDLPAQLETDRLLMRGYRAGDGPWYFAMSQQNREHLMRYEAQNPAVGLKSEEDAEILMREMAADWVARNYFIMGAWAKATGAFVAQVYIGCVNWDLPEFEVGYFVDKDHEGQGFVTEAVRAALGFIFEHLHAHRVRLCCDDTNTRSYRVAERCGFIKEGHLRENTKNGDGTLSGTLYYGILRHEYEAPGL